MIVIQTKKTSLPLKIEEGIPLSFALNAYDHPGKKIDSTQNIFKEYSREEFFLKVREVKVVSYIVCENDSVKRISEKKLIRMKQNFSLIYLVSTFFLISVLLPWRNRIGIKLTLVIVSVLLVGFWIFLIGSLESFNFVKVVLLLLLGIVFVGIQWALDLRIPLSKAVIAMNSGYFCIFFLLFSRTFEYYDSLYSLFFVPTIYFLSWGVMKFTSKKQKSSEK